MPRASTERRRHAAAASTSALRALRHPLPAHREGWLSDGGLAAARLVADDARRRARTPERMLVALEGARTGSDEVRGLPLLEAGELAGMRTAA